MSWSLLKKSVATRKPSGFSVTKIFVPQVSHDLRRILCRNECLSRSELSSLAVITPSIRFTQSRRQPAIQFEHARFDVRDPDRLHQLNRRTQRKDARKIRTPELSTCRDIMPQVHLVVRAFRGS